MSQFGDALASKMGTLERLNFGARTAEDEADALANYFVQTDQWKRMLRGEIDVVYGPKGSGKSAIYTLLQNHKDYLFANNIMMATAENPRGATIFRSLVPDPPMSERSFIELWKIYILCILGSKFREFDLSKASSRQVVGRLVELELLPPEGGLARLFRAARDFARRYMPRSPSSVTVNATLDPVTGLVLPSLTADFSNASSGDSQRHRVEFNVDELLEEANSALSEEGFKCWILFDRLDVAFEESRDLERNALRSLFRVYNDLRGLSSIGLKIFVRDDIWRRITSSGFAEASHITRTVTIKWDNESLMNLAVRRLLSNACIIDLIGDAPDEILKSIERQRDMFYKIYPQQIDSGPNKPDTFEWILGRTKDGAGVNAPRELIHFLTELRDEQIRRLERGEFVPPGPQLFDRSVFKAALKAVSDARLTQTLLAEYSELRTYIMALRGEKTLHTLDSLARIWAIAVPEAHSHAGLLVSAGFFEQRGSKEQPQFWVPFLYRDALDMVQGTAE